MQDPIMREPKKEGIDILPGVVPVAPEVAAGTQVDQVFGQINEDITAVLAGDGSRTEQLIEGLDRLDFEGMLLSVDSLAGTLQHLLQGIGRLLGKKDLDKAKKHLLIKIKKRLAQVLKNLTAVESVPDEVVETRDLLAEVGDQYNVLIVAVEAQGSSVSGQLVAGLKTDSTSFLLLLEAISINHRFRYVDRLKACVKHAKKGELVRAITLSRGVLFELDRINKVITQGQETLDFDTVEGSELEVTFKRFVKDTVYSSTMLPMEEVNSKIELDVPLVRDGKQFVYEVKNYPRKQFGESPAELNQLLKYQAAIEQNIIDGATIELRGRLSKNFLFWALGGSVIDDGGIPDVEIIYNLLLPSGAEYRFVLKKGKAGKGLKFANEDRTFSEQDTRVINGLFKSIIDRDIIQYISDVNVDNPSEELAPFTSTENGPFEIERPDLFVEYENKRRDTILARLEAKKHKSLINNENLRSSTNELATPENIYKWVSNIFEAFQNELEHGDPNNRRIATLKKKYLVRDVERRQRIVDKVVEIVGKVREFELARLGDPAEHEQQIIRQKMGFYGLSEGVALDVEHIIMDAIQMVDEKKKIKRSYEGAETFRFLNAGELQEYLTAELDRSYRELKIYDPLAAMDEDRLVVAEFSSSNESERLLSEKGVLEKKVAVVAENFRRAETAMVEMEAYLTELKSRRDKSPYLLARIKQDEGRLMRYRNTIARIKVAIQRLEKHLVEIMQNQNKKIVRVKKIEAIAGLKKKAKAGDEVAQSTIGRINAIVARINAMRARRAAEFKPQVIALQKEMQTLYEEKIGEEDWQDIGVRILEENIQNIIKFIYVIRADGELVVSEEIIRGEVSGRAAHSELANGRNVYGAGELAFSKDEDGKWVLVEINNGSGHYRPNFLTLDYVEAVMRKAGIDTSKAVKKEAILRALGTPREMDLL